MSKEGTFRARGILLGRLLETLLLMGAILTIEKTDTGLAFSALVANFDFSIGVTRAAGGVLLSTRLFGYLISLVTSCCQLDLRKSGLVYLSLVLAALGAGSHLSEALHAFGLLSLSVQVQCSAVVVGIDWLLYAQLVRSRAAVTVTAVAAEVAAKRE